MNDPTGRYNGQAVPADVHGLRYGSYTPPANWANPTVGSQNLMVHRDELRTVARSLGRMASSLQTELLHWEAQAGPATDGSAAGRWHEAQELAYAIRQTHAGVSQFVGELVQAHADVSVRLDSSADRYDDAEHANTTAIRKAESAQSATRIQAGGVNQSVDPTYGMRLSPQEQAAVQRLITMNNPGGQQVWNGTVNVTDNTPFQQGSVAGYSWQEIRGLIQGTDPDAITNAGDAYQPLYSQLTSVTQQLAAHGETLADNWGGASAVAALSQVQMLHQTATDLQANTWAAGQALSWYGPVLKQFQANLPEPQAVAPPQPGAHATAQQKQEAQQSYQAQVAANLNAADQAAQQRLAELNGHIGTAYNAMPPAVNKNLPPTSRSSGSPGMLTGTGAGGAGGGSTGTAVPAGTGPGGGGAGDSGPGGRTTTSAGTPVVSPGAPVHLAGGAPAPVIAPAGPGTGVSAVTLPPGGPVPAGVPAVAPAAPELPGFIDGTGGTSGTGPGVVTGDGAAVGDSTTVAGTGPIGGDASGDGLTGFPMAGGGPGGSGGAGRVREIWEGEDEGTWGVQGDVAWTDDDPGASGVITAEAVASPGAASAAMPAQPVDGVDVTEANAWASPATGTAGAGGGDGEALPLAGGAGSGEQRSDRPRQFWTTEDPDLWASTGQEVPPVIE